MSTIVSHNSLQAEAMKKDPTELAQLERRAKRFWVGLIVCFLGVQVAIGGMSIYLAVGDPSVAVIPNYHQSALDWDVKRRSQQLLDQLDWDVHASVSATASGERLMRVEILGAESRGVDGLSVRAKVFHHARGEEIFKVTLPAQSPGVYENSLSLVRPGLWQVELTIEGDHGSASKTMDIEVE